VKNEVCCAAKIDIFGLRVELDGLDELVIWLESEVVDSCS